MARHRHFNELFKEACSREEVSAFIPPEYAQQLAESRTRGLVSVYLMARRYRLDFEQGYRDLIVLVNSAYLQGVYDTVEAQMVNERQRAQERNQEDSGTA